MTEMTTMDRVKAEAEQKMAIVDALTPEQRAIVHEIGLSAFSLGPKTRKAYLAAKRKAGIKVSCRKTQSKQVVRMLVKEAA